MLYSINLLKFWFEEIFLILFILSSKFFWSSFSFLLTFQILPDLTIFLFEKNFEGNFSFFKYKNDDFDGLSPINFEIRFWYLNVSIIKFSNGISRKDFLKSIHDNTDHNQSWDETKWQVPVNTDVERQGLSIGSISEFDTLINFDNTSYLQQENLENLGIQTSANIPLTETL